MTTLIIDPGKEHLCSFGIFLEYERLIYFFNESDRCQLGSEKKEDLESCSKLSESDIFRWLRCEVSICEFLPEGKEAGEGLTYCTLDCYSI